jgi:hypothetical protein
MPQLRGNEPILGLNKDISVLEMDVFGIPAYDEEVILNTEQEKPTFDEYPDEEEEELEGLFISCLEPISEKPSPRTSQPASIVHPPVLTRYIQPYVSSYGEYWAVCYNFFSVFHSLYEPVSEYME